MGTKADMTPRAIEETVALMLAIAREVPQNEFRLKQLDALNSFVFNVDTPEDLVEVYGRYRMRGEPLDTLEVIQEDFLQASPQVLSALAGRFLGPDQLQIFVTADKDTPVVVENGRPISLKESLAGLAERLNLEFKQIPLR
jgi:predicted Zn-dependent peptidase